MSRVDPLVGRVIDGRYLIESGIASGGMASVYLAVDRRLARKVALKVMHEQFAVDEEFAARFVREAQAAARLSHPNVVQVFDQGADGPVLYLAMEYLPGRTLRDVLTERGALTPRETVFVLEPVLAALSAAHRAGIVHGDVKPENVILTDDGRIKVADFGLARAISSPISAPINVGASGELLGTVAYLAPELVSRGVVDARTDVYAAGIMLFELLTGKQPFTGTDPLQLAYRHVHESVPAPTSVALELPLAFDGVVLRATSHDPDQRPSDAGALLSDLHAAQARVPDAQLDIRAAWSAALPLDPVGTQTRVLTVSRRQALSAGSLLPRLKVHEDEPGGPGLPGDRRRQGLAAIGAVAVVVLLIFTAVWWFSSGPGSYVPTPSVAGRREGDAQRILSSQGLLNRVTLVFNTKVAAGQVLSSNPAGGAKVKKNGTVVLTVSKGPQLIAVPDVGGKSVSDARTAIKGAGLKVGTSSNQFSASVAQGNVISTSPTNGTEIAPGETVDLVVSAGAGGFIKGLESSRCVDVPPGVQDNQTPTTLDDCTGAENQTWTATSTQQLTLYGGTKCLDVAGNSITDGAIVQLYDCNGGPNQQWTINADGTIVGVGSGKCLDATNHGTGNGTPIQIWDCTGGANQKWFRS